MKTKLVRAALACAVLLMTATAAMAGAPIPGVDVIVRRMCGDHPCGALMVRRTDGSGRITLKGLASGDYVLEIDGQSLAAAIDKLAPSSPKHSSAPSLRVGGSLFGGGSHASSGHEGGPTQSGPQSGGGGVGLGVTLPMGSGDKPAHPQEYWVVSNALDDGAGFKVSNETPYYHDNAAQGMRTRFTVPPSTTDLSWTESLNIQF